MTNSITLFEKYGLVNANVSYSEVANAFLTSGYTSIAGNTYFNSIRIAEGILIKEDVGQGYYHTFLNGIKIFSIKDKTLIADKRFHNTVYSKRKIQYEAKEMLLSVLRDAAQQEDYYLNEIKAKEIIDGVLTQAIYQDQRDLLVKQAQKYL